MHIFDVESAPTPSCHASTIAQTATGLMAAWFGGEYEKHPSVSIFASRFDGECWSVPVRVAEGRAADGSPVACWNPVLFVDPKDRVHLFYKVGAEIADWQTWQMTSDDNGVSWSKPRHLGGGIEGPVRNKPLLVNDVLVCPSSSEPDWHHWQTWFSLSPDLGATWQLVGPVPSAFQAIQPTLLQHPDGQLQALVRTREGVVGTCYSQDGGFSWSMIEATALPNPNSGIDALTLTDGRHLIVYNPTVKGRSPLVVALSNDGKRWERRFALEDGPGEYSYPAVIEAQDGGVHITYTSHRKTITHRKLDVHLN